MHSAAEEYDGWLPNAKEVEERLLHACRVYLERHSKIDYVFGFTSVGTKGGLDVSSAFFSLFGPDG